MSNKVNISYRILLGIVLITLFLPLVSQAGCCECYPDFKINGQSSRQCFGGSNNQNFSDFNMCEIFCTNYFPSYTPPQGYPSFSNFCEANTNCPVEGKSCCIYIDSYTEKIKKCTSNITQAQCNVPITKYVDGKTCEELNCAAYIGRSLNSLLPTEYTPPEKPAEEVKPVYFVPQVTIPGSITIGGKEFRINKGVGIEITGSTAAQYFAVFYRFFVAALAVIAIVMVMWGGYKRIMAAGSPEGVKNANETIMGAITGVVIALLSYSLLSLVNPALVSLKPLEISDVLREEFLGEQSDSVIETGGSTASVGWWYKQCDPAWATMAYTESNNNKCNLCSSGCGVAATATVLGSLGINVTPKEVGQYAIQVGARKNCSGGTSVVKLAQTPSSQWGVQTEIISNFDEAMQLLEQSQRLVVSIRRLPVSGHCTKSDCGSGICFCGGHYIVLEDKAGDNITVFDPSRVGITSLDVETLRKYLSRKNPYEFIRFWK